MINLTKFEVSSKILEILQLLQKIHQKFRKDNEITDKADLKRRHLQLK
jgi:hypothetical protein